MGPRQVRRPRSRSAGSRSTLRPSTRSPRSTIRRRTSAFSTFSKASRTAPFLASSTPSAPHDLVEHAVDGLRRARCFSWVASASRDLARRPALGRAPRAPDPCRPWRRTPSAACRPARARSFWMRASCLHCSWPKAMRLEHLLLGRPRAPPASTISDRVLGARDDELERRCFSCSVVGLAMSWPSTRPTRTAPTGPERDPGRAAAPRRRRSCARMSGSFSWSAEITRPMICISLRKPSGNSGRIGRSISREVRISFLTGAPSRLKYPPGMRPPA